MASILTEEQHNEVMIEADDWFPFWIGGDDIDREKVWKWSDGSPWNYTKWETGQGNKGAKFTVQGKIILIIGWMESVKKRNVHVPVHNF